MPSTGPDGLPLPSALLMIRVTGHADADRFYSFGRLGAQAIAAAAERHGRPLDQLDTILDWGCGCGRIARHWQDLDGVTVAGCDHDSRLVRWCREHLPFVTARVSALEPPLPWSEGTFDLVYGLSVFTHLSTDLVERWVDEMRRVLAPGGLLLFTTKGDDHAREQLPPSEYESFRAGDAVVVGRAGQGTNQCAAYHPHEWVTRRMEPGFEVLEFDAGGAEMVGGQDLYVARRA